MTRLPAFCESCGAVYPSPLRARRPGRENAFDIPVPCPACGESGRVPAELLVTTRAVLDEVRHGDVPADEREAFFATVEEAGDGTPADLLSAVARRAPTCVPVARRLPDAPPPVLRGIVQVLRAAVELAERSHRDDAAAEPDAPASDALDAIVARAVERVLEEEGVSPGRSSVPEDVRSARERMADAGRNDPCPCGSGEKYKDCHWMDDLRLTRD